MKSKNRKETHVNWNRLLDHNLTVVNLRSVAKLADAGN